MGGYKKESKQVVCCGVGRAVVVLVFVGSHVIVGVGDCIGAFGEDVVFFVILAFVDKGLFPGVCQYALSRQYGSRSCGEVFEVFGEIPFGQLVDLDCILDL